MATRPTASPARWPYREHRNMAQVMANEAEWEGFMGRLIAVGGYTEESEFIVNLREAVARDGIPDMRRLRTESHKAKVPQRPKPRKAPPDDPRITRVLDAVADQFKISRATLTSKCRSDYLARARFAAMLALRRSGLSFAAIAQATGRKDHTTCCHGVVQAERYETVSPQFAAAVAVAQAAFGDAA